MWRRSGLRRFFVMIRSAWRYSRLRRIWMRFWGMEPNQTVRSWLYRWSERLNTRLAHWRTPVRMLHGSLLGQLYGTLCAAAATVSCSDGCSVAGMTRILLFAVALYLPIDYVLRDLLHIPVLSSLWDEALLLLAFCWILRTRMARNQPILPRTNVLDAPVLLFIGVGMALMFGVSRSFPLPGLRLSGHGAVYAVVFCDSRDCCATTGILP